MKTEEEIIKNLREETKNIKLSSEEKELILKRVINSKIPSPYIPIKSNWQFTQRTFIYVLASFLIVVFSSGTLAYASLNSIPGEDLYGLKIKITEPLLDNLAFSSVAKAERKAEKALRRLDEAKKLAEKDALTPPVRLELETRFKENTEDFEKSVEKIDERGKQKKEDLDINFEKSLEKKADILKDVSTKKRKEREEKYKEEKKEEIEKEENIDQEKTEVDLLEIVVREKHKEKKEARERKERPQN